VHGEKFDGFVKGPSAALRFPPEAGKHLSPAFAGAALRSTSMYASFLNLPAAGRHSRALHLEPFTVPSSLTTFYEFMKPF
jgi:hypothetical protein